MYLLAELFTDYFSMTIAEPVEVLSNLIAKHAREITPTPNRASAIVNTIHTHRTELKLYKKANANYMAIQGPAHGSVQ